MPKGKMIVWGGFTKRWEKKKSERQRPKGKLYTFECRISKNSKEGKITLLSDKYYGHLMRRAYSLDIAGKDWRREEKRMTDDGMVGWHYWLNGHEFEKLWTLVMDRETWRAAVSWVTKSQTWLSDWTTER